ncbi:MAG TPA: twin-arginine translocase TatA/TatE family subunit [Vicinamibacteria bacterium]|nr:twin-arginine translocase TatA/TatE family subunit [Vicinamibacteria bacterium]
MFGLGFPELILIFVIVIVIFGTSRIPELGKGLGEGIRNFKKAIKDKDDDGKRNNSELEEKKG